MVMIGRRSMAAIRCNQGSRAAAMLASGLLVVSTAWTASARADEAACSALKTAGRYAATTVSSAHYAHAGTPSLPGAPPLPAYCEVTAEIAPVEGSHIGVVYRLPDRWNGKLLGLGGGGLSGFVALPFAAEGLARGYATLQTDTGHPPAATPAAAVDGSWIADDDGHFNWPAIEDFAHRAVHLMTVVGKEMAVGYYGRPPAHAYFEGCSTGGRQGLVEAERYPGDYDGVVAGAPTLTLQTRWLLRARPFRTPDARVAPAQLTRLAAAATAACDALDGLEDGLVADPRACSWQPTALSCAAAGADAATCLSPKQIGAVEDVYAGVTANGRVIGQPEMRGGEAGWLFATGADDRFLVQPKVRAVSLGGFEVDADALTPSELDARISSSRLAAMYDADNPDLGTFARAGGKLIVYQGWLDSLASPPATAELYGAMEKTMARAGYDLRDNARLFMMPGVGHCGGGPGPARADFLGALEAWVEQGRAPDAILARRVPASPLLVNPLPTPDSSPLERPLCPYPQQARYHGGDPAQAASFRCESPARRTRQ